MNLIPPSTGEYRDRLRFDREQPGPNIGGETTSGGWTTLIDVRAAAVLPTRGGSDVIAERLENRVGYDIWLRHDHAAAGIRAGDRAVNLRTGEVYALGAPIDPTNRRQWLLVQATSNGKRDGQG